MLQRSPGPAMPKPSLSSVPSECLVRMPLGGGDVKGAMRQLEVDGLRVLLNSGENPEEVVPVVVVNVGPARQAIAG